MPVKLDVVEWKGSHPRGMNTSCSRKHSGKYLETITPLGLRLFFYSWLSFSAFFGLYSECPPKCGSSSSKYDFSMINFFTNSPGVIKPMFSASIIRQSSLLLRSRLRLNTRSPEFFLIDGSIGHKSVCGCNSDPEDENLWISPPVRLGSNHTHRYPIAFDCFATGNGLYLLLILSNHGCLIAIF